LYDCINVSLNDCIQNWLFCQEDFKEKALSRSEGYFAGALGNPVARGNKWLYLWLQLSGCRAIDHPKQLAVCGPDKLGWQRFGMRRRQHLCQPVGFVCSRYQEKDLIGSLYDGQGNGYPGNKGLWRPIMRD
jgi:hypothetical protein